MSYLNAQSHAFHPLFNVGEHDMILSIFLTNFSFRTFDTVDFLLLCVRSVSMMFTVYHNNPFLSFSLIKLYLLRNRITGAHSPGSTLWRRRFPPSFSPHSTRLPLCPPLYLFRPTPSPCRRPTSPDRSRNCRPLPRTDEQAQGCVIHEGKPYSS